jgi:tetratricopeptide (TPR) repeat protein
MGGAKPAAKFVGESSSDATLSDAATQGVGTSSNSGVTQGVGTSSNLDVILEVGTVLGGRYEIVEMLGIGGMGAVYKAHDRELDRIIALKVVRPDLARNPEVLQRFKQELLTARQVTHKNVIRIFDLAEADGIKFITMEYVAGPDLRRLLADHGKLAPAEAIDIIRQVCTGVAAAHAEGVIHRDLKPGNIMRDAQGRVVVMDFGLARNIVGDGMTKTGAMLGTVEYMSPEQAKAEKLDGRSDLFTIGVILYELLTGNTPYKADSAIASLLKRTQEPAVPAYQTDPSVPRALSDILGKVLERDPAQRYQSVQEFIDRLDEYQGGRPTSGIRFTPPVLARKHWMLMGIVAVLVVVIAIAAKLWMTRSHRPAAPVAPITVIIADFNNHTGDPVFSGTLESTLRLALEGASFISAYDRTKMKDLGVRAIAALDESKAQEIAANQGLNVVVSGSLDRRGADYQLSLRAVHTVTGKVIASAEETAPNKDQVLFAVTKLGTAVRKALGDATSESAQRLSMETLTAVSLEAVHEYASGLDGLSAGRFAEAQMHLLRAVDMDPNFGMAYTIMASAARNQGRLQEADQYIKEALKHIDRMTERERYRTRAYLYLLTGDYQKCVDEYGALLERYPADTGAYTNISVCRIHLRNVPKALEEARRAVAILPKRAIYHANLAMSLAYNGDFPGAGKEADEALKLGYSNGYLLQAFARLGQDQPAEAAEAYHGLEKTIPSDARTGLADLAVYEGRYSEAVAILEKGAADDLSGPKPDRDGAATKFWMLAQVQRLRGQTAAALLAAKRALELNNAFQTRFVAAQVYAALGETAKARQLAVGLAKELQIEPQAYAKLIEGEIALKNGDGREAVALFTAANNLLDTWIGRFDLGRAYVEIGRFAEADSEFDRCIKRRGEALSLFLDFSTYGYFPPVYYYQGRAREGMKTAGFAESYKKYLSIRGKAGEDPLLAEVRKRLGE